MSRIAFIPRRPTAMAARADLAAWLDRSVASHALVVVRGPAGVGKTSVVADWAARADRVGAWVALEGPLGRTTFWTRVISALIDAGAVPADSLLRDTVPGREIEDGLRHILTRGMALLPHPVTLVLDDAHHIADDLIHEDLHWLMRTVDTVTVVLVTRTTNPFERAPWAGLLDTAVLTGDRLSLTLPDLEEVSAALGLGTTVAGAVHDAFRGWALPSRSALLELASGRRASTEDAIAAVRASGGFIVDESAHDLVEFLERISVAPVVTPELAELLGGEDARAHLLDAERRGIGTWSATGTEFSLHPFIRESLEARLQARPVQTTNGLRSRYAGALAQGGKPMEAARQYVLADRVPELVRLLRRFYGDILRHHFDEFTDLLAAADQRSVRDHPELLAFLVLRTNSSAHSSRLRLLQLGTLSVAIGRAKSGRGAPVERITLLMATLAGQRLSGAYDHAVRTADQLVSLADGLDADEIEELSGLLAHLWLHIGTTYAYAGRHGDAEQAYRTAIPYTQGRPWTRTHAENMLALSVALRGDLVELDVLLAPARIRQLPHGWRGTYTGAGYHLAEATLALDRLDAAAALEQLDALAEHEHTLEHWPVIAWLRASAALVEGRHFMGVQGLDRDIADHRDRATTSRPMAAALAAIRADLLIADHQVAPAEQVLREYQRDAATTLVRARLALVAGRHEQTLSIASGPAWGTEALPRRRADALLLAAAASLRLGHATDARAAARHALDMVEQHGFRRSLMAVPRSDLLALLDSIDVDASTIDDVPHVATITPALLSPAEHRVLVALEFTGRVEDLAASLNLSANTVKTHLRHIYRKLDARSRQEAIALARVRGIIPPDRL